MDNFLLGKSNFFNCLKNQNFRKFACKTRYSFVKLPEKLKFFGNLPVEIEIFLPGFTTPQISNHIDAGRCCYPSLDFSVASSEIMFSMQQNFLSCSIISPASTTFIAD